MNDEQHAYWEAYIRALADLFGLRDYEIQLSRTLAEDCIASNENWKTQRGSTVSISQWFMGNYSPEEQRETILHELFHIHDRRHRELIRIYFDGKEGGRAKLFLEMWNREFEYLADRISIAVAHGYPLPENRPHHLPSTNKP